MNGLQVWEEFELESERFLECRKTYKKEFIEIYNKGFDLYKNGDWEKAKNLFEKAQEMMEEIDNPIRYLLEFIDEHNCVKPFDWNGMRIIYDFNL